MDQGVKLLKPGQLRRSLCVKGLQQFPISPGNVSAQDYELEAEKLRSILDLENGRNGYTSKKPRLQSPAAKVKEEVSKGWPEESQSRGQLTGPLGVCNTYIYCGDLGPTGNQEEGISHHFLNWAGQNGGGKMLDSTL